MTERRHRAEDLGKKYLIGHQAEDDVIARGARGLIRSAADILQGPPACRVDSIEEFCAVK